MDFYGQVDKHIYNGGKIMEPIKAGVIGCGNISSIYMKNVKKFKTFDIIACADIDITRAEERAKEFNIALACLPEELLENDAIDIIINLTTPNVHAKIATAALQAGKHVYGEKPFAITREEGREILKLAKEKNLVVGSAPDTFLGGGLQTCRKLIDDGWIGAPVSATAFMMNHGHESWHPNPDFYYQKGAGPMFDMGPYYLTALISLLGPIRKISSSSRITFPERTITSNPRYGEKIQVNTPTQINGVIDFESGAIASIITSFDVWHHRLPFIEVYGTEGSLAVPDPNTFDGPVLIRRHDQENWREIPLINVFTENNRGLGIADMAFAILNNEKPRASGELAYHVLDVMQGFLDASVDNQAYSLNSTCEQPKPLPSYQFLLENY